MSHSKMLTGLALLLLGGLSGSVPRAQGWDPTANLPAATRAQVVAGGEIAQTGEGDATVQAPASGEGDATVQAPASGEGDGTAQVPASGEGDGTVTLPVPPSAAENLRTRGLPESDPSNPRVVLETSKGSITIELMAQQAPISVANFLSYVETGHYDGTIFHRMIPNFMVQGGGFDSDGTLKSTGPPIVNEAYNGLRNRRGTVAMARAREPNSATSQFFINLVDNRFLDQDKAPDGAGYAVFGIVVDGQEVLDRIRRVNRVRKSAQFRDWPVEPIVIKKARRL